MEKTFTKFSLWYLTSTVPLNNKPQKLPKRNYDAMQLKFTDLGGNFTLASGGLQLALKEIIIE